MPNEDLLGYNFGATPPSTPSIETLGIEPKPSVEADVYAKYQRDIGQQILPHDAEVLNEMAYQSQSWGGNLIKGLARVTTRVWAETLSIPGTLAVPFTGWDNMYLDAIRTGHESFNQAVLPVYMSKSVTEGGVVDKFTDGAFWATTASDGFGMLVSYLVPGAALKAMNVGGKIAKGIGAAGRGLEAISGTAATAADLTAAGNRISGLGRLLKGYNLQRIGQSASAAGKLNSAVLIGTNSFLESAAEANQAYLQTREELSQKGGFTEQQVDDLAGNVAGNVFGVNLAITLLSNTILEAYVFKGFDVGANVSKKLKGMNPFAEKAAVSGAAGEAVEGAAKVGGKTFAEIQKRTPLQKAGGYLKGFIVGGGEEALQEGSQTTTTQYFVDKALNGEFTTIPQSLFGLAEAFGKNVTDLESTENSKEFYEAATLGALLGAGPGLGGAYRGMKQEERILFGGPARPGATTAFGKAIDRVLSRKPMAESKGLIDEFRGKIEASTINPQDLFLKDKQGNFVIENGEYKINEIKLNSLMESGRQYARAAFEMAAYEEMVKGKVQNGQISQQELSMLDTIKHRKDMMLLNPYINFEGGVGILEEHIDAILDRMEAGEMAQNPTIAQDSAEATKRRAERKTELLKKAKRMTELNNVIENMHYNNVAFLDKEEGTPEQKMSFFQTNLWEKKQVAAALEHKKNLLSSLERQEDILLGKQQDKPLDPNEELELKNVRKRIETENKMFEDMEEEYQNLFDNEWQKGQYRNNLNYDKIEKERAERYDKKIKENADPNYVTKLFKEQGYDIANDDLDDIKIEVNRDPDSQKTSKTYKKAQKEKAEEFSLRKSPNGGYAIVKTVLGSRDGLEWWQPTPKTELYLADADGKGNYVFQEYQEGVSTPKTVISAFLKDPRYTISIEGKEARDEKKKIKEVQQRKEEFENERKKLLEAISAAEEANKEELNRITELIAQQEKSLKEQDVDTRIKEIQNQIEKKERLIRAMKTAFLSKVGFSERINELEKSVAELKDLVKDLQINAVTYKNNATVILNEIAALEIKRSAVRQQTRYIQAYANAVGQLKEKFDQTDSEQFMDVLEKVANTIAKNSFAITDENEGNTLKKALGTIQNTFEKFISDYDKVQDDFGKYISNAKDKVEGIRKELTDKIDALNESEEILERLEKEITALKEESEKIENNLGELRLPVDTKVYREKRQEMFKKIEESKVYKEKIAELKAEVKRLNELLDQALKGDPQKGIHTVENLYAIAKGLKDFEIQVKDVLVKIEDVKQQQIRIEKQRRDEISKQQSKPENTESDTSEKLLDLNLRTPFTPYLLTGLDVKFDPFSGKDMRDKDGNVELNNNPYQRNWFDFMLDTFNRAKSTEELNKYKFVAVSIDSKEVKDNPELLNAINQSFAFGGSTSTTPQPTDLFVFVYQNGKPLIKNGKPVFTSFRKLSSTNTGLKNSFVKPETISAYSNSLGADKARFDSLSDEQKKNETFDYITKRYNKFIDSIIAKAKNKNVVLEIDGFGSAFLNIGTTMNKVSDVFPWMFKNGKPVFGPNNFGTVGSNNEVVASNGRVYVLPSGTPYVMVNNVPVILHQKKIGDMENKDKIIDTIIGLYAELNGEKNLDKKIGGQRIIPQGSSPGLIDMFVNHGVTQSDNQRLYISQGSLVFGPSKSQESKISLEALSKYTKGEELTPEEIKSIESLKEYLADRYFFLNKSYIGNDIRMPQLENGKIVIMPNTVNYNQFMFEKVFQTPIIKDRPFLQVNIKVKKDQKEISVTVTPNKQQPGPKPPAAPPGTPPAPTPPSAPPAAKPKGFQEINQEAIKQHKSKTKAESEKYNLQEEANRAGVQLTTEKRNGGTTFGFQQSVNYLESIFASKQVVTLQQALDALSSERKRQLESKQSIENIKVKLYVIDKLTQMYQEQMAAQGMIRNQEESAYPDVGLFPFDLPPMEALTEEEQKGLGGQKLSLSQFEVEGEETETKEQKKPVTETNVPKEKLTKESLQGFLDDPKKPSPIRYTNDGLRIKFTRSMKSPKTELRVDIDLNKDGSEFKNFTFNINEYDKIRSQYAKWFDAENLEDPTKAPSPAPAAPSAPSAPAIQLTPLAELVKPAEPKEAPKPEVAEPKDITKSEFDKLQEEKQKSQTKAPKRRSIIAAKSEEGVAEPTPPPTTPPTAPVAPAAILPAILPTKQSVLLAFQNKVELGRGGNAIVYDIPGTDFVLRVPKGSASPTTSDEIVAVADPFDGRNFGQPIATIGQSQILHRQSGIPAGLTNYRNLTQEEADEQYVAATIAAASMPQSAYDKFAADLMFLNSRGALFDGSKSNNVLIDSNSGQFNLVDINQNKPKNVNNGFSTIVVTLMGTTYAYRYKGKTDLTNLRKQIYDKTLAAAKKTGLPFSEDSSTKYSQELAGIKTPTQKDKVITLDKAKSILKNLQESDQVTTKCE